jgi:hypothetical protein
VIRRTTLTDRDAIDSYGYTLIGLSAFGLAAIAAHSLGVGGDGTPSIASPYPIPLVLPAFMGVPPIVVGVAVGLIFAAWSMQLVRRNVEIPRRSFVLFFAGVALSAFNFVMGWAHGVQYQGLPYALTCLAVSIALALLLLAALMRNRTAPSAWSFLAFHVGLFGWLATYAMPYLGEGP